MDKSSVTEAATTLVAKLQTLSRSTGGLRIWRLRGRELLPVVQGGMGVGVSAASLAGTVASPGGVGMVSAVDLRRHQPDLMAATAHLYKEPNVCERIDAANLVALDREIQGAKTLAQGRGLVAVNAMEALSAYEQCVQQAPQSGAKAVVVDAGLPLDLPEFARDHTDTARIPSRSDARGVQLLVRKWEKKGQLPDAIVIEHPRLAGGHLGAAKVADLQNTRFDFEVVIPQVLKFFKTAGIEREVPLIAAGGSGCRDDILRLQAPGASAVQLGTAFAVTRECDADLAFKRVLAKARPEDLVEFISVAGLPARAVRTPWLDQCLRLEPRLKAVAHLKKKCNMAFDCLADCGLRDGKGEMGQFCIDQQLAHALDGDTQRGLFFRGTGVLPFRQQMRPVLDLMRWLLENERATVAF